MPPAGTTRKSAATLQARDAIRHQLKTDLFALASLLATDPGVSFDAWARGDVVTGLTHTFHRPLCRFHQTTPMPETLTLAFRGSFKSHIISGAKNVQRILRHPEIRILLASNKGDNATGILEIIKLQLSHPWLVWAFPDILSADPKKQAPEWVTDKLTVKRPKGKGARESTIETIGITGELTSRHYDHTTFDDIVGEKNSQSRIEIETAWKFVLDAAQLNDPVTRWGAPSTTDHVATPWHYADVSARLREQRAKGSRAIDVYVRPCWVPDPAGAEVPGFGPVRPTFPERFPLDWLLKKRAIVGPSIFAAQYLMDPISADTVVFAGDALQTIASPADAPADLYKVMTLDPAITERESRLANYTALCVSGFDSVGNNYVLDLRRGLWSEHETINQIYDAWQRTPGIVAIAIESVGFQKIYRSLLEQEGHRRGFYLPHLPLPRDNKVGKTTRIRALEPPWTNGTLIVCRSCPAYADFLEEATRFRLDRDNLHDDLLDAVVDTYQLRALPREADPLAHLSQEERAQRMIEDAILADRAATQAPPLDTLSMRQAVYARTRRQAIEAEAALAGLGAGPGGEETW